MALVAKRVGRLFKAGTNRKRVPLLFFKISSCVDYHAVKMRRLFGVTCQVFGSLRRRYLCAHLWRSAGSQNTGLYLSSANSPGCLSQKVSVLGGRGVLLRRVDSGRLRISWAVNRLGSMCGVLVVWARGYLPPSGYGYLPGRGVWDGREWGDGVWVAKQVR